MLQCLDEFTATDGVNGCIELVAFVVEGGNRLFIALDGTSVQLELCHCVGNGQQGFLHGRIGDVARGQFGPRYQRAPEGVQLGIGPAGPQQGLVRQRPGQAHPFQCLPRLVRRPFLQIAVAECEVGLVAQQTQFLAAAIEFADAFQLTRPRGRLVAAQLSNPKIVGQVRRPGGIGARLLQYADGLLVASKLQQRQAVEVCCIAAGRCRQLALNLRQRPDGARGVAALPGNLRQVVPGPVAHCRARRVCGQQALENVIGGVTQAVGQVKPAQQQLRRVGMVRQALLLPRNLQAHNAVEIIFLVEMKQDLAIREVLHGRRGRGQRRRQAAAQGQQQHVAQPRTHDPIPTP